MTRNASKRTVTITIRAEKSRLEVIDRAAAAVGKSRSEFVLDAAWVHPSARQATGAQ